ncbi:MAG: hypothetical protein ACRC92_11380 [Peptostreptococcaceae bacterium]
MKYYEMTATEVNDFIKNHTANSYMLGVIITAIKTNLALALGKSYLVNKDKKAITISDKDMEWLHIWEEREYAEMPESLQSKYGHLLSVMVSNNVFNNVCIKYKGKNMRFLHGYLEPVTTSEDIENMTNIIILSTSNKTLKQMKKHVYIDPRTEALLGTLSAFMSNVNSEYKLYCSQLKEFKKNPFDINDGFISELDFTMMRLTEYGIVNNLSKVEDELTKEILTVFERQLSILYSKVSLDELVEKRKTPEVVHIEINYGEIAQIPYIKGVELE